VHLAVAAVVLAALLAIGGMFAYNFCLARSQNRIWCALTAANNKLAAAVQSCVWGCLHARQADGMPMTHV
jgi:hypothetical protein